jgi:glycosyltransferase involved in cell wall biosynthesis
MNILFISMTHPTSTRPRQGMFNAHLIESIGRRHNVRVVAPIAWPQRVADRLQAIVNRSSNPTIASHVKCPTYFYLPKLLRSRCDMFYFHSIWPTVQRICNSWTPDIVVGYWVHPDGSAAQQIAEKLRVPCVIVSGGSDLKCLPKDANRRAAIVNVLSRVNHLIVVSNDLKSTAIELGVSTNKIEVIYRGLNRQIFHACERDVARAAIGVPNDALVVMWSGRLEPVKNPLMLIEATIRWKQIWGERLIVMIAGAGRMRSELERRIRNAGLTKHVRMEGNLAQHDLALRYNASDVMTLTSHSEGIPNVLLESIACGTPFVATDVGGVSEIATSGLDRLIPNRDVNALVEQVVDLVNQGDHPERVFQPRSLDESARQFEAVFCHLCDQAADVAARDLTSHYRQAG